MTVTDVRKDLDALTMTLTAEFAAPVERVWQVWADPRLLERWWGPPTYPATVVEHDLVPGGKVGYFMTSPDGETYHGWWLVRSVTAPHGLEFEDGFADSAGAVNPEMPVTVAVVSLSARPDGGTTMVLTSRFQSREAFDRLAEMGMEQGLREAVGQIDGLLT